MTKQVDVDVFVSQDYTSTLLEHQELMSRPTRSLPFFPLLAVAAVFAVGVAACGDDSTDPSTPPDASGDAIGSKDAAAEGGGGDGATGAGGGDTASEAGGDGASD
jgi:hypothetical protein